MDLPFEGPLGVLKGLAMGYAWRGLETFMQISFRNQVLVAADMVKSKVFGRDLSDL
jgi:NADH:ubiquinone reductase (non-electrogenic)